MGDDNSDDEKAKGLDISELEMNDDERATADEQLHRSFKNLASSMSFRVRRQPCETLEKRMYLLIWKAMLKG